LHECQDECCYVSAVRPGEGRDQRSRPRDGLQIEPFIVPTEGKVAFVNALARCGFARIEATSFTSARAIPALADAEAVMHQVERVPVLG
jgi:hydroxymethylglutaryl-CoA lyase